MPGIFSAIAGLLFLAGFVPYIRAIWHGETKPNKASWLIWTFLDAVTLAGMYAKGTENAQIVCAFVGSVVVLVLALKHGKSGWSMLDKASLIAAITGVVLWAAFSDPDIGIVASLVVVTVGSFPTFVSAWNDPGAENKAGWTLFFLSCVFGVMAITEWTLASAAQPIAFLFTNLTMVSLIYCRPGFNKATPTSFVGRKKRARTAKRGKGVSVSRSK